MTTGTPTGCNRKVLKDLGAQLPLAAGRGAGTWSVGSDPWLGQKLVQHKCSQYQVAKAPAAVLERH